MADKASSGSGGDWTAGIVAIFAALLLGSAAPIGLYFGLYKPKVADRIAAEEKKSKLMLDMDLMLKRSERVTTLENEGDAMSERVKAQEAPFAEPDVERLDVPEVRAALLRLAEKHHLALRPERQQQLGAEVVYAPGIRIRFAKGLMATKLTIEALAYFHDFGRFVTQMETLAQEGNETSPKYIIIPEELTCTGDTNGGSKHVFVMSVYVIERRDVDSIGR
ncbi:MAG: hypothetical protein H6839_10015 [Planctomycetes bacterium]|nr:hypothetical protein [Planctomycetota bacterium]